MNVASIVEPGTLRTLIASVEKLLRSPFAVVLDRPSKELFADYLAATAHIIRASTNIMAAAVEEARRAPSSSSDLLINYLTEHIAEEQDHYEWILEDLVSTGVDARFHLHRTSSHAVFAVPGIAYYFLRNISPWSVLGYVAVLEGTPPSDEVLGQVIHKIGLKESAVRTLRLHGELDHGHADELFDFIETAVDQKEKAAIRQLALLTLNSYASAMSDALNVGRST